ncbi:uncharacterized protein METZ01_LOCUS321181, partial [marine metagenome]
HTDNNTKSSAICYIFLTNHKMLKLRPHIYFAGNMFCSSPAGFLFG